MGLENWDDRQDVGERSGARGQEAIGLRPGWLLVSMSFQFALDSLPVGFDASLSVWVFFGLVVVQAEAARAAGLDGPQLHDHPLSCCAGYPL